MTTRFGIGSRVLVVDRDTPARQAAKQVLSQKGFEVVVVSSVERAIESVVIDQFDLFLIDQQLEDGSGLDLSHHILKHFDDSQVILQAEKPDLDSAIEALRAGVSDYLHKPVEAQELAQSMKSALNKLVARRRQRQTLMGLNRKNKRLESMVIRDPLTGLFNHAHFQDGLAREVKRSARYQRPMGLLFVDVDNFKQINDKMGHLQGDRVLKALASILRGSSRDADYHFRLRRDDIAARYGGDEFVLLLPETNKSHATTTAERLRLFVEEQNFGEDTKVTLSIGVAGFPDDGADRDSLIVAADSALYVAKRNGRNQVIAYSKNLAEASLDKKDTQLDVLRLAALQRAIAFRDLAFVYQPLFTVLEQKLFGYEALCRPSDNALDGASELLAAAEQTGRTAELGRLLREMAIQPITSLSNGLSLFVNLHPMELYDRQLVAGAGTLEPFASRIVFEITQCQANPRPGPFGGDTRSSAHVGICDRPGRLATRLRSLDERDSAQTGLHKDSHEQNSRRPRGCLPKAQHQTLG